METGFLHLHNILRWVILLFLIVAIFRHLTAGSRPFNRTDRNVGLWLLIFADLMLIIGFYQWYSSPLGLENLQNNGMSAVMKDRVARFWAVEHPLGMLIAIILIHIGRAYSKRSVPDTTKHKRIMVYFLLALLIILISIPWPFREGIGRPWLPGIG
jgi:hypothetical protein